jgi:hypothetical protein
LIQSEATRATPDRIRPGVAVTLRRWAASVFLPAPKVPVTWSAALVAVVAVLVGTGLSLLRQPAAGGLDTMWAEDGQVLLADAANKSFLRALVTPFSGYYQAVPRLLAESALLFPASWAAAVYAIEAALATALLALVVYVASAQHLPSRLSRLLVASIAVASPLAITGIPVSLANVHWPGMYALFWILLWSPGGRAGRVVGLVIAALIPATNILVILFVPLALARAVTVRGWHSKALSALVCTGAAFHLVVLATAKNSRLVSPMVWGAVSSFFTRTVPATLLGEVGLGGVLSPRRQDAITALAWLIVLAALVVAWRGPVRPKWTVAGLAGLYSALLWGTAVASTGVLATRYTAAAGMLVIAAIAALLIPKPGLVGSVPTIAALLLVAVLYAVNLHADYKLAEGPSWTASVRQAREQCAQRGVRTVDVVIAPPVMGWGSHLSCRYLLH